MTDETWPAFFELDGTALVPTTMAQSMWSGNQLHGVAVSGALARGIEARVSAEGRDELVPTRYTVDLFRPATMDPATVTTEVVRAGRRIMLVDAVFAQNGERVARASAIFLAASEAAPGEVWAPASYDGAPPEDVVPPSDEPRVPFFHSDSVGWSQDFGEHQSAERKQSWNSSMNIVPGERPSGFVAAASTADGGSMVTNWGTHGVEYINTDITLTLARRPVGSEIGLAAVDRVESAGIAVGTAAVFDRVGPLGTVVVTSLANTRRSVDFSKVAYTDDGERTVHPGA